MMEDSLTGRREHSGRSTINGNDPVDRVTVSSLTLRFHNTVLEDELGDEFHSSFSTFDKRFLCFSFLIFVVFWLRMPGGVLSRDGVMAVVLNALRIGPVTALYYLFPLLGNSAGNRPLVMAFIRSQRVVLPLVYYVVLGGFLETPPCRVLKGALFDQVVLFSLEAWTHRTLFKHHIVLHGVTAMVEFVSMLVRQGVCDHLVAAGMEGGECQPLQELCTSWSRAVDVYGVALAPDTWLPDVVASGTPSSAADCKALLSFTLLAFSLGLQSFMLYLIELQYRRRFLQTRCIASNLPNFRFGWVGGYFIYVYVCVLWTVLRRLFQVFGRVP